MATCKVCAAHLKTIKALELANATLVEMVNLQRAIPAAAPLAAPEAPVYAPLVAVDGPGEDDAEEIMARMNDPATTEEDAEALLAQLQALNTRVERAD